jgi:hypothetical protein
MEAGLMYSLVGQTKLPMRRGEINLEFGPIFPATALTCHARKATGNNMVLNTNVKTTLTIITSP